jgi:membrane protease YdiL (CAAX protease family)
MKKMDKPQFNPSDFFVKACIFEASLILVAILLGWIADIDPFENIYFSESAIVYGIVGTLPLVLMFIALEHIEEESFKKIRRLLLETLGPGLHGYHWADLFILAVIAGISEEILFRGVIQPWMEMGWGFRAGLIGSNIVFGLVHAVTPLYAVLASLVGIYLGLALDYEGDRNVLIPIIIHSLYDFLAFVMLMRAYRANRSSM